MGFVSNMDHYMRLTSYTVMGAPAEVVSGTDESFLLPLPALMDTILANTMDVRRKARQQDGPAA